MFPIRETLIKGGFTIFSFCGVGKRPQWREIAGGGLV
jgi:hypothetical protein